MTKPTALPDWNTTEVNSVEPDSTHKLQGWLAPGGIPEKPPFQTFNHWMNNVYKWLAELNEIGILVWDSGTTYRIGSIVLGSDGNIYKSNTASNVGNDPTSDAINWSNIFIDLLDKTSAQTYTGQKNFARATLTEAATILWSGNTQQSAKLTLTAGTNTLDDMSDQVDGGDYKLKAIQGGAGGYALAYHANYKWANDIVPDFTGYTAGQYALLAFESDGTIMSGSVEGPFG